MVIRPATKEDIRRVAQIHKEQFSDHFLGKYSVKIIDKYYNSFLSESIFLISEAEDTITGFVMGGDSYNLNMAKKAFIKENIPQYLFETLIRPNIYVDALKRIKGILLMFKSKHNENITPTPIISNLRLLSIAVTEEAKGNNTAKRLLESFEESLNDINSYGLSVLKTNLRAINFYKKNGFVIEKEDTSSIYFIKVLKE